jgi:hypothetical protein
MPPPAIAHMTLSCNARLAHAQLARNNARDTFYILEDGPGGTFDIDRVSRKQSSGGTDTDTYSQFRFVPCVHDRPRYRR